jgi:polysaccharide biosynthesis/export protein
MKFQYVKVQMFFLSLIVLANSTSFAQNDLQYVGQDRDSTAGGQVAPGQSNVSAVNYNTNYSNQFAPYSSFMSSPYGQQQFSTGTTPSYPQASSNPATVTARDPLMGSEVSPFSHYSPYIEVVGEGSDYTLGIDDVITVIVRNQPDFSGRYVVDPEGNIQYNFAGDIKAEGKTKGELKAEITERLKGFIRHPDVAVMISEYRSKAVYVFGFVNQPGKYAMKGNKISVKEAVVAAGLPRADAAVKRVYVIRPSQYTQDGKPEKKKVDLKSLLQKGISAEDFILQPGDTIVVNQRFFDKFINNFSRIVGPVFQSAALYELGFGNNDGGFFTKDK